MYIPSVARLMWDIIFRSTLEAQYAACFSLMGADWEYEPEYEAGFAPLGWLPDFYLSSGEGASGWYVEVKPRSLKAKPRIYRDVQRKIERALTGVTLMTCPSVWLTDGGLERVGMEFAPRFAPRIGKPHPPPPLPPGAPRGDVMIPSSGAGLAGACYFRGSTDSTEWYQFDLDDLEDCCPDLEIEGIKPTPQASFFDDGDERVVGALLPVGFKSWSEVWAKACRVVEQESSRVPTPDNPVAWKDDMCREDFGGRCECDEGEHECPECGGYKKRQYQTCYRCAEF